MKYLSQLTSAKNSNKFVFNINGPSNAFENPVENTPDGERLNEKQKNSLDKDSILQDLTNESLDIIEIELELQQKIEELNELAKSENSETPREYTGLKQAQKIINNINTKIGTNFITFDANWNKIQHPLLKQHFTNAQGMDYVTLEAPDGTFIKIENGVLSYKESNGQVHELRAKKDYDHGATPQFVGHLGGSELKPYTNYSEQIAKFSMGLENTFNHINNQKKEKMSSDESTSNNQNPPTSIASN